MGGAAQGAARVQVQRAAIPDVQRIVVVQIKRAGHLDTAVDVPVRGRLRQRRFAKNTGRAAAAHDAACPLQAAADVEIAAAAEVGAKKCEQAVTTDCGITVQRELAAGRGQGAATCNTGAHGEHVSGVSVAEDIECPVGRKGEGRAVVGTEHGAAAGATVQIDVAVSGGGGKRTGRADVKHAAVLDVEPVIVCKVQPAGNVQPPLQGLVAVALRKRSVSAERGGARAVHASRGPLHIAADVEIAAAVEIRATQQEVAAARNYRIAHQGEGAAAQRQRSVTSQLETGRKFIAGAVVGIQVDPVARCDIDACTRIGRESGGAATGIQVNVAVMRGRAQCAGRTEMQVATVADIELVVVLQIERAADDEFAIQIAVAVVRGQFPVPGQRDGTAAGDHAAIPDQSAERQWCITVECAVEEQRAGDGGIRAVDVQRAVVDDVVTVNADARCALQSLVARVRVGRRLQRAAGGDGIAELQGRAGAAHRAQQDVAFAGGQYGHDDVGTLIAGGDAVAVSRLHRDAAVALRDDAQIRAMCTAGDQIDAGAGPAFFSAEVARFDQQAAALGQRQLTACFSGCVAAAGVAE